MKIKKEFAKLLMLALIAVPFGMAISAEAEIGDNPTTNPATSVTSTDATLNGTNGDSNATGHSFWASANTFSTASPSMPAGVYSTVDLGPVLANTSFSASLSSTGMPAITPNTTYHFVAWSLVDGTWYPGEILTLNTDSVLLGELSAEDFGVVNYDTGATGELKGYTAGFGLADATLEGATSVVVKLYAADDQLLQTNTAILSKFNADVDGTQFSTAFDVSGTFNYSTDGYWTNVREAQYGQSVSATKVVATVTLANGKVVTAENTNLVGDPTTIYPEDESVNNPTTNPATSVTSTDATLNGTNGDSNATGHSFWASLSTFSTDSTTIPAGVYSTANLGAITANTSFSALLSEMTGMPAITPNTTYHFVAWSLVDGTWYPGEILTLTTGTVTPPANTAPVLSNVPVSPVSTPELSLYSFDANATDADMPPQTLTFSLSGTVPAGAIINASTGVFTWTPSEAQGPGSYTFDVVVSDGSLTDSQSITINVTEVSEPNPDPTTPSTRNDCKKGGWKEFGFKNQGQCVSSVARNK